MFRLTHLGGPSNSASVVIWYNHGVGKKSRIILSMSWHVVILHLPLYIYIYIHIYCYIYCIYCIYLIYLDRTNLITYQRKSSNKTIMYNRSIPPTPTSPVRHHSWIQILIHLKGFDTVRRWATVAPKRWMMGTGMLETLDKMQSFKTDMIYEW